MSDLGPAGTRGIVLLVIAVVIGLVLLSRGGGGNGSEASEAPTTTAPPVTAPPTTAPAPSTTLPVPTRPPGEVKVAIFNATGYEQTDNTALQDAAGTAETQLTGAGYTKQNIVINDTGTQPTTVVLFKGNAKGNATAIANLLQLPASVVKPVGQTKLPAGAEKSEVVVILGQDAASNPVITAGDTSGAGSNTGTPG